MRRAIPFDTSALISLGHATLVQKILETYTPLVTPSVISELEKISERDDRDARAARMWLAQRGRLEVVDVPPAKPAERELLAIASERNLPLVIDDIRAVREFDTRIDCIFSVHVIYGLYRRGSITKAQGLIAIQTMRTGRTWKENAISIAARVLFE